MEDGGRGKDALGSWNAAGFGGGPLAQRIKQERHDRENEETKRPEWDEGGGQRAGEEE